MSETSLYIHSKSLLLNRKKLHSLVLHTHFSVDFFYLPRFIYSLKRSPPLLPSLNLSRINYIQTFNYQTKSEVDSFNEPR